MIGRSIAGYELGPVLGEGAQATVYAARAPGGATAAMKVLPPQIARDEPDRAARFLDEARAIQRLDDPGIVRVISYGRDHDSGCLYIVMEQLDGVTLAQRIKEHRCTLAEAIEIISQLATALEAAHDHVDEHDLPSPIVHRDLKPENIFLCAPDDQVKIVDFGIAKLAPSLRTSVTLAGASMFGSPPYMAPEQWRADAVDHRADLYALGCILWELLTGAPPFGRDGQRLYHAHCTRNPGPLSSRAAVSPGADRIAARLLEKHPDHRFQSCAELREALEALDRAPAADSTAADRAPAPLARPPTPPWIVQHSPASVWVLAFLAGWWLFGISVILDVGNSYGRSPNWGPNYIAVVPLIFALMQQTIRDAHRAFRELVARGMVVDPSERPVGIDHPTLRSHDERLRALPGWLAVTAIAAIAVCLGEWWVRYHDQPVENQWWVDSAAMGVIGALAQGVLAGSVLTFLITMIAWAWFVAELGDRKLDVHLRADRAGDARHGFEPVAAVVKGCMLVGALNYVALYASHVQHIALEYGRRTDKSALLIAELFRQQPLLDLGPRHISSTLATLSCVTILACVAVINYLLHRVFWRRARSTRTLGTWPCPARFAVLAVVAGLGFVVYQLGALLIAGLAIAALLGMCHVLDPSVSCRVQPLSARSRRSRARRRTRR
jgi:serine/threonine protein kinase